MATHSSVLAWRIPGTEEPGGLPSMGPHRVGHDWSDLAAAGAHCGQSLAKFNFLQSHLKWPPVLQTSKQPSWWWRWCRSEHRACAQPQGSVTEEPPGRGLQECSGRQTYWRQERVRDGRTLDRGEVGGGGGQTRRHSSGLGASEREGRGAGLCVGFCPPWVLRALKECWKLGWPSLCLVSNSFVFCHEYFSSLLSVSNWDMWKPLLKSDSDLSSGGHCPTQLSQRSGQCSLHSAQKWRTGYLGAKKWTRGNYSLLNQLITKIKWGWERNHYRIARRASQHKNSRHHHGRPRGRSSSCLARDDPKCMQLKSCVSMFTESQFLKEKN